MDDRSCDEAAFPLDEPTVSRLEHTKAHAILEGRLYLGPAHSASNEREIIADGITHILNVTKEVPKQQYSGVAVLQLQCHNSPQQPLPFGEASAFIDACLADGGKCLVHCNAGQSRSASIIIHCLMSKGYTLKESHEYVKARKPDIRPNYGFYSQLQAAERSMHGKCSLDTNEYKADTLCEILEGSGKTREDVLEALRRWEGDGELALGMLLG